MNTQRFLLTALELPYNTKAETTLNGHHYMVNVMVGGFEITRDEEITNTTDKELAKKIIVSYLRSK